MNDIGVVILVALLVLLGTAALGYLIAGAFCLFIDISDRIRLRIDEYRRKKERR